MGVRRWSRGLQLVAAAAMVVLMTGLIWDGLRRPRGAGGWDGPASEFGLVLIPALFYIVLTLVLFALSMDLAPAAPGKGDLAHLLILKRHGGFPFPSRRGRPRPGRWRLQIGARPVVGSVADLESALDRLVSRKRRGA